MSEETKGSKVSKPFFTGKYAKEVFKPIEGTSSKEAKADITPEAKPEEPTFAASLYGEPRGVVNSSGHALRKTGAVRQIDHGEVTLAKQLLNQNSTTMPNPFSPTSVNTPHEHYTRTPKTPLDPAVTTTRDLKKVPKEKKIRTPKPKVTTTRQISAKF